MHYFCNMEKVNIRNLDKAQITEDARIEMKGMVLTLVDTNGGEVQIREFQGGYLITQKGTERMVLMPFASNAVQIYSIQ